MEIQRYTWWPHGMGKTDDVSIGKYILVVDHLAAIKEMQDMIAFLIAFVPDMTERGKYLDWLAERRK
jgi:hypothetical protein